MSGLRTLIWIFTILLLAGCANVPVNLPPVTEQATNSRYPGRIIWHELITDVPDQSKRFYEELFGWEFERIGPNFGAIASANYTLIRNNGKLIGGMIDETKLDSDKDLSQWVGLMSTANINRAVETLTHAGGTVFTPPTVLADRGRIAVVADAEGALFSLLETKDGDPPEAEPQMHDFMWDEMWSQDVDASSKFYSDLTGLEIDNEPVEGDIFYRFLSDGDHPRFGILANPLEGLPPLWTAYLRVEDPAAIVARVEELGGRVLVEPQDRPLGGQVALIVGPSGAGIALQTWSPEQRQAWGN